MNENYVWKLTSFTKKLNKIKLLFDLFVENKNDNYYYLAVRIEHQY